MKRIVVWLLLLPAAAYCLQDYPATERWVSGRALVNFKAAVGEIQTSTVTTGQVTVGIAAIDELFRSFEVREMYRVTPDGTLDKMNPAPDMYRLVALNFPDKYDVLEVCRAFEGLSEVEYAEPDLLRPAFDSTPNDIMWNQQWDKRLMNCDVAWDFSRGSHAIQAVAVDNGFWWPHPDAYDNIWVNPGEDIDQDGARFVVADEYPGDLDDLNGVDDDGNGYVDDFIGWDFIDNIGGCDPREDCDNQDNETKCIDNHGTHTLGAIGAVGNNEIGLAGCNWNVSVMPSRAGYLPNGGTGLIVTSAAIATMNWSVALGVDVINMSYGSSSFGNAENNAVQAAWANGALLCGASGNDGVNSIHYPAGYNNVVSVGSVNQNDIVSDFSNYGTWVDCYAPGEGTQSLSTFDGYANEQGTSMSSPNAAGVFALIWSIFPDFNNAQLRDLMLPNCVDITELNPSFGPGELGYGRIDAQKALAAILPFLTADKLMVTGDNDGDNRLETGETGELRLNVSNADGWFSATDVAVSVTTDDPNLSIANGTFTIGSLGAGQSTTLANPSAQITCNGNVPYSYSASFNVHFQIEPTVELNRTITMRIGRARTLVVDDDGGASYAEFFSAALAQEMFNYDDHSTVLDGQISAFAIQEYEDIIWACGNVNTSTLTQSDRDALQTFLDAGGNLMFVSQGADEDLDLRNSSFYGDYLHASSGGANGGNQCTGVSGDPISDGANLVLLGGGCAGNGNVSPSVLNAVNGGVILYNYLANGLGGAVRYGNGTYKSVYFGFALEAACGSVGSAHHRVVTHRVMEWFGATAGVGENSVDLPSDFTVSSAYPNPFNPEASVQIELVRNARVRATVHDVLGRQVELIADRSVSAGVHTLRIDGASLPSGSYWLNVSIDGLSNVQRIILLK
ncbi:MAG: S8 family peptidase [bacterium]|nr:S8 family peptidase [bacterium]